MEINVDKLRKIIETESAEIQSGPYYSSEMVIGKIDGCEITIKFNRKKEQFIGGRKWHCIKAQGEVRV